MRTKLLSTIIALVFGISAYSSNAIVNNEIELLLDDQIALTDGKYGADSMTCLINLSLYREYYGQWKSSKFKSDAVNDALTPWREVYNSCPKSSENMYKHGLKMMRYKMKKAEDDQKAAYVDTIVHIYHQRIENFPNKKGISQKG